MFKKTRNIETSFQYIRIYTILINIGAFVFSAYVNYSANRKVDKAQEKIYILSSGKILEAFASDRKENIPAEARDHIRTFHQYFFTLEPDEKVITANITRALYLADASAKRLYDNLKENGYYAGIISGNISQEINVDSVDLDMGAYPFHFRCWATQRIIRPTSLVTRNLITEGWLRNTSRSDNDPHGFLIERWNTLENKDVNVEKR